MKKLYIVVRYIAPLKYFEKLIPALSGVFDVSFLFLEDKGMIEHCRAHSLPFVLLPYSQPGFKFPFISHVLQYRSFVRRAEVFMETRRPALILTETSLTQPIRVLLTKAHEVGSRSMALQWCPQVEQSKETTLSLTNRLRQIKGRGGGGLLRGIAREGYFTSLTFLFVVFDRIGLMRSVYGGSGAEKLGVMDERGRKYFLNHGWEESQIQTVGFADWTTVAELCRRVRDNPAEYLALEKKYNLSPGRKRVLLLSTVFYAGHATLCMTKSEQLEYFRAICADIWSVYPKAVWDILFKLHPRDEQIYSPLQQDGALLFGNDAEIEELMAVSGLYVAHSLTAANFTLQATGIPALFINLIPLAILDVGKELYSLLNVVHDRKTFRAQLKEAYAGTLPLQYDASQVDHHSLQKIVDFIIDGTPKHLEKRP